MHLNTRYCSLTMNRRSGMWSLWSSHTYSVFAALPQAKTQAQRFAWCFFFADFRRKAASSARFNSENKRIHQIYSRDESRIQQSFKVTKSYISRQQKYKCINFQSISVKSPKRQTVPVDGVSFAKSSTLPPHRGEWLPSRPPSWWQDIFRGVQRPWGADS